MTIERRSRAGGEEAAPRRPVAAAPRGGSAHPKGELILIPKQLRAEWMDAMAVDPDLSPMAFKVAGVIGSHFNRHSGDTYVSQETLADVLQLADRTVRKAIGELEARGYLIVQRRDLGERSDGRRVCGGRGVANVYLPAFERSQVAATNAGRRFADRIDEAWQRTHQRASIRRKKVAPPCHLSGAEGGTSVPPLEAERWNDTAQKVEPPFLPTLGDPSDHNPARARAPASASAAPRARRGAAGIGDWHPLGLAADLLVGRLGKGAFETWFGQVTLEGLADGVLRLGAPTRFMRDYLASRHDLAARDCWNKAARDPKLMVKRVEFVVVNSSAAGAAEQER